MNIKKTIYTISIVPSILLLGALVWASTLDAPQQSKEVRPIVYTGQMEVIAPDIEQEEIVEEQETSTPIVEDTEAKRVEQKSILYDVPFTSQAPTFDWDDIRQQNACEEASALMAMAWVRGEDLPRAEGVVEKLLEIDAYERENYNAHLDTSAADTISYIFNGYFSYEKVRLETVLRAENIINELSAGNLVIIPADGRKLGNPHFTAPGPERHMLLIIGYDPGTREFITNDPGTQFGKSYRYDTEVLYKAIRDYETGYHVPIEGIEKVMIVVEK